MRRTLAFLLTAVAAFSQDAALARIKQKLSEARSLSEKHQAVGAAQLSTIHADLRNWMESRLPKSFPADPAPLEKSLNGQLVAAGIQRTDSRDMDIDDPALDSVGLDFETVPGLPSVLLASTWVRISCGGDAAIYGYRYDSAGATRVFENYPSSESGYGFGKTEVSAPDGLGRRLLLIKATSTQCASTWMGMTYSVYRFGLPSVAPETLLSEKHGFWLGNDGPEFVLKPDQMVIEFLDSSIDGGVHNRTYLLRYDFSDGVKRVEPFAFQPQDFAEDWLKRPWSEMQPFSAPATQKWHAQLHADMIFADYTNVVPCAAKPDRWMIGFNIRELGEKELAPPIDRYFLVRDLGHYHYQMEAVSDKPFEGCPGHGDPSDKHPGSRSTS